MKVWTKNRNYKIEKREDGWVKVYNGNRMIAVTADEDNARQVIWLSIGGTEYVDEKDFEEVK